MEREEIDINTLINENKPNHYKLLTIIGNNPSKVELILEFLKRGWQVHDEEKVFEIYEYNPLI